MSVGDSAEESISIHALGRERLLVFSCGLPSYLLKILLGDDRVFGAPVKLHVRAIKRLVELLSQFSAHQPPNLFSTEN